MTVHEPVQAGLWGDDDQPATETTTPAAAGPVAARPDTNDLALIATVIRAATDPGYVLLGPAHHVYARVAGTRNEIDHTDRAHADAVAQLIRSGLLAVGATHLVRAVGRELPARSVRVTPPAAAMVRRWDALHLQPTTPVSAA